MRGMLVHIPSYLKEYCSYSGVHGVRYLSEERGNVFERLFWIMAIAISIFGCSMMVAKIKTKMDTTPLIVTLAENPTKNWHVPFPAVTICPGSPVLLRAFNYTKYIKLAAKNKHFLDDFFKWTNESRTRKERHDFTSESSHYDAELPWLSNSTWRNSLYKKLWALNTIKRSRSMLGAYVGNETLALDEEDMDFLVEVAPKMNNGIDFYKEHGNNVMYWKAKYWNLDRHFRYLWSDYGICYTFNMMDDVHIYRDDIVHNEIFKRKELNKNFSKSNDWDPDKGYTNVLKVATYPWRAPHERKRANSVLNIMMTENEEDIEGFAGKESAYYEILFHQPQDHPIFAFNNAITMPFDKYLDIILRINVMTTSPGLEKYDPHKRQCYYSYEKHLEYFKFYSQSNCLRECLTNLSLRMCGCVQFTMPRYKTTKVCGVDAWQCYSDALTKSDQAEILATLKYLSKSGELPFNSANIHEECDCLPNCLSISYEADVLTTRDMDLSMVKFGNTSPPKPGERFAPAGAWVRMQGTSFTAIQRSEYYGQIDFLANCGGFLGLFCGFSILSFVEIIYFLTIRLWANLYQRWSSKPSPGLREGLPDAEDPAPPRSLAFNISSS